MPGAPRAALPAALFVAGLVAGCGGNGRPAAQLLRQRSPLPGAPYGLAYDARRDLALVTLTARNEVVGLVVSASGAGLQVIDPERVVR